MRHALLIIGGFLALGVVLSIVNELIQSGAMPEADTATAANRVDAGASPARASILCRLGFHNWGKPYDEMDNGYMENCKRRNCDALHEVVTDEGV